MYVISFPPTPRHHSQPLFLQPIFYGFSSLLASEFHTVNGPCSRLVPSGQGYDGISIANQVCSIVGAEPGQLYVDGDRYVQLSFSYYFGQIWRVSLFPIPSQATKTDITKKNYAILCAFGVFFILCLLLFTEYNTYTSHSDGVTRFKRGSKATVMTEAAMAVNPDEEKRAVVQESTAAMPSTINEVKEKQQETLREQPVMTNTFSWQHMTYVISTSGGKAKLLDDVSGFVSPGKLTALMGASGAGKVTSWSYSLKTSHR